MDDIASMQAHNMNFSKKIQHYPTGQKSNLSSQFNTVLKSGVYPTANIELFFCFQVLLEFKLKPTTMCTETGGIIFDLCATCKHIHGLKEP
jgi:hypothetical protein